MTTEPCPAAVLLTGGRLATSDGKTAQGLIRGPSRFRIVGVVDGPATVGRDVGELHDGERRGLPVFANVCLDELDQHIEHDRYIEAEIHGLHDPLELLRG